MYKDNNQFYEHSSHTTIPVTIVKAETETEWGVVIGLVNHLKF